MQTTAINLPEIKEKLIEKLRPSGWGDKLKGFVQSSDFDRVIELLYNERVAGRRFTPVLKDVFRAFETCPYKDLRVVIIGQDPYPQMGIADGIAFSCSNTWECQPSLDYIIKAIKATVDEKDRDLTTGLPYDLQRWSKQGVLLLNSAFTTEIGKPGTHYHIWEDFMAYTLDIINSYNSGLVFVFMGKKAQEFEPLIGDQHHKIFTTHPASAAYAKMEQWDSKDMFNQINKLLIGINGERILW